MRPAVSNLRCGIWMGSKLGSVKDVGKEPQRTSYVCKSDIDYKLSR
jgi:hypothetical protein